MSDLSSRKRKDQYFRVLCRVVTILSILVLVVLLSHILSEAWGWLSFEFLDSFPSRFPEKAGLKSALYGTIWLIGLTAIVSVPVGVASAVYLQEYAPKTRWIRLVEINIANLAGMPSIIYGLLGLAIFVRFFDLDRSLWAGALTLSLLILPVIIIASKEAIKAVPMTLREGAYAVGARKWQAVFLQVLPSALPGILTGIILALSRAIGESAPLIMIGGLSYVAFTPEGPHDPFTALPIQIFNWASRPQEDFHHVAAAGIVVLLVALFTLNLGAVLLRQKYQRYRP